jgi:alpha-beta hydrolase superfamily lysophospholipase
VSSRTLEGVRGEIALNVWTNENPEYVAVISHGYAEHSGRYAHVAERLVEAGATVYAHDHLGHGRSEGEPALIEHGPDLTADLGAVIAIAQAEHPGLPVVLIGHSMGGIVVTRWAQQNPGVLAALVLSGPVIGRNPGFAALLELDPIPEVPIDVDVLSRDPEVGRVYDADPLVYSGPFKRETLESMFAAIDEIAEGPGFGELPLLWLHGEEDALAPLDLTRPVVEALRGEDFEQHVYPQARHEVFNETNQDEVIGDLIAFAKRAVAP